MPKHVYGLAAALVAACLLFSSCPDLAPGNITVVTPQPVSITLPVVPAHAYGTELVLEATVSPAVDDGTWCWYIDGLAQTGQSATFSGGTSLGYGRHTIMATLVQNDLVYSASRSFLVQ